MHNFVEFFQQGYFIGANIQYTFSDIVFFLWIQFQEYKICRDVPKDDLVNSVTNVDFYKLYTEHPKNITWSA